MEYPMRVYQVPPMLWLIPNREDCNYPDKDIAGCMVTWLLLSHVREVLILRGALPENTVKLSGWLDLVALGTVADAVSLSSAVNRAVVQVGLIILNKQQRFCWRAMTALLDQSQYTTEDLGFQIGPRINARGRLADPHAALNFLMADSLKTAKSALKILDNDNMDRRKIEKAMIQKAAKLLNTQSGFCQVIYHPEFHPGVQGIVASRLVDKFGKPTVILSPGREDGYATGSARSIPNLHILNVLKQVNQDAPSLLSAFGGHAGAAGLTLAIENLSEFHERLDSCIEHHLEKQPTPEIWTDGQLNEDEISLNSVELLNKLQPFGRGFEAPQFAGIFEVSKVKPVGPTGNHLQLRLLSDGIKHQAIWFNAYDADNEDLPIVEGSIIECAYRLSKNNFRGESSLQLVIEHAQTPN